MTLEEILSMDPEYPGDIAVELEKRISERIESRDSTLSEEENIFYKLYWFEMDLMSGGFSTFFYNRGHETNELMGYLELIEATPIFNIFKKTTSVFPEGNVPEDEEKVMDILRIIDEEDESEADTLWNDLDDEYLNEYEGEISNYLVKFVMKNKDKFK